MKRGSANESPGRIRGKGIETRPTAERQLALVESYLSGSAFAEAVSACEQLLARDEAAGLSPHQRTIAKTHLATAKAALGKYREAELLLQEVWGETGSHSPSPRAPHLALRAAECCLRLGSYRRARTWLGRARSSLGGSQLELNVRAHLLLRSGPLLARTGSLARAREVLAEARDLFRQAGKEVGQARAVSGLALVDRRLGRWEAAGSEHREAVRAWERLSSYERLGRELLNFGILHTAQASWHKAERTLMRALGINEVLGNKHLVCLVKLALARLYSYQERWETARELAALALTISRREGFRRDEAIAHEILGDVAAAQGDLPEAERSFQAGLSIGEEIAPSADHDYQTSRRLAALYLSGGDLARAEALCRRSRTAAARAGDLVEVSLLGRIEAELACARGEWERGARVFARAESALRRMGARCELAHTLLSWGRRELEARPEEGTAAARLSEAGELYRELGLATKLEETLRLLAGCRTAKPTEPREERRKPAYRRRYGLVGRSAGLVRTLSRVRRLASTKIPVVIQGETGTGKEILAKALHEAGPRRAGPLVVVNCAAFPEGDLLYSELFGAARGAFTGCVRDVQGGLETAHGGTLFLDELEELPPRGQASLLRFLETGEIKRLGETKVSHVDVRLVSAAQEELAHLISQGKFRRDLYYRLAKVTLSLPPLRERGADVSLLIDFFLERENRREAGGVRLGPQTRRILETYPWPGNVRQLESEISALVALAPEEGEVTPEGLSAEIRGWTAERGRGGGDSSFRRQLAETEAQALRKLMSECEWVVSRAARRIGMSRNGLVYRLRRLGIERPR